MFSIRYFIVVAMLFFPFMSMFADSDRTNDKTIVITKNLESMPNIQLFITDNSEVSVKTYKMLIQDLKIIGSLNVFYSNTIHENISNEMLKKAKDDGISLVVGISVKENYNNAEGFLSILQIYDLRDSVDNQGFTIKNRVSSLEEYPFLAHDMSYRINAYMDLPQPDWVDKYIVFSDADSGAIYIADYTLTYRKKVVDIGLNLFPKWADSSNLSFYYTMIDDDKATIYKYNIETEKSIKILSSQGMAVVSDVSKNGDKLLITMSPKSLSDVFLYDTNSGLSTQLTTYSGIDVNGHFINNEKSFVFVSDRLGYPNVFIKDLNADATTYQLIYRGKYNNSISTFDNYVVYSSREKDENGNNASNLYLASLNSSYVRQLSRVGTNVLPSFSKDGDSIMFLRKSKEEKENALGIIRLSTNKSFLFPLGRLKIHSLDW